MIVPTDKGVPTAAREYRRRRPEPDLVRVYPAIGDNRRTADLVSASRIGRRGLELPQPFDLEVLLGDPCVTVDEAAAPGVRRVGLAESFTVGDLVPPYVRRPR